MRFGLLVFVCVIGCGRGDKTTPSATVGAASVSTASAKTEPAVIAPGLWMEYGNNQAAADGKYLGKKIITGGPVRVVRQDEKGYYIGFGVVESAAVTTAQYKQLTEQQKKWYNEGYPPGVICYFAAGEEKNMATVKTGSAIAIKGKCAGLKRDEQSYKGYIVVVEGCRLLTE